MATTAMIAGLISSGSAQAMTGPEATPGQHTSVVKLTIGEEPGTRTCTGSVLDASWILTAASCFAATPGSAVPAGKPSVKATAVLSNGQAIAAAELVPRPDRDVVLVRLTTRVTGIAGTKLGTAAPQTGTDLSAAGFGRTKTEWMPGKLHTGTFTLNSSNATTLAVTGKNAAAICMGDTGGPLLNAAGEIVAVNSRSWQGGCLGTPTTETRTGAISARADDLGAWIAQTTKAAASVAGGQQITASAVGSTAHVSLIGTHGALYNTGGNYGAGQWSPAWQYSDAEGMTSVTSVNILGGVRLFGIGAQGKVFGKDLNPTTGQWTAWNEVPGGAEGAKDLTATAIGTTLHLNIIGSDGALYNVDANYDNGQWSSWTRLDGEGLTALTSVAANNVVHIYGIAGGKVFSKDANYTTGKWSTWVEVPGGAGGAKNVSATANGNTVYLAITGSDKALYTNRADYNTGQWGSWTQRGGNRQLASLTSTVAANGLHVYGIGTDGRAYTIDANLSNGSWGANWAEIPGGLGS